jgi:tyrosinase
VRAWIGIQNLPPTDPYSFFTIGGYHGEPFVGIGATNNTWWGGYCNHGNILFPVWHRAQMLWLENAMRSIKGCEDVTMPYWDEADADSIKNGIPDILTQEQYKFSDGETVDNPLRSFVLPVELVDNSSQHGDPNNPVYSKPKDYHTCRYPQSGLVSTAAQRKETADHNKKYSDPAKNTQLLNANIVNWLTGTVVIDNQKHRFNVAQGFKACLDIPYYTVFSNTSSAQQWNHEHSQQPDQQVTPIESPHNSIHLAVGGFDYPGQPPASAIPYANGDMGENETAALDPIFFFHHCNIDRMFYLWQKLHGQTDNLPIMDKYAGTKNTDVNSQPVVGQTWGEVCE